MTALLEAAPALVIVEERQPDAPRTCTRGHHPADENRPCYMAPQWEAMCMGCGHVFLRCEKHYNEHYMTAKLGDTDQCHLCARCNAEVYIQQYGRI